MSNVMDDLFKKPDQFIFCDGCLDYDPETRECIPTGEYAGPSVFYCSAKRMSGPSIGDAIRRMTDLQLAEFIRKLLDSADGCCKTCPAQHMTCMYS